jgi:hypothetical protein
VEALLVERLDLRALDHPAIADKGDLATAKPRGDLIDLRGERLGVLGISGKDFDGQWAPCVIAQQPNDNLPLAAFAIAVIAKSAKGVVFAFEVGTGNVVQEQTSRRPQPLKETSFDLGLLPRQPIEIGIEIVLVKRAMTCHSASGPGGG